MVELVAGALAVAFVLRVALIVWPPARKKMDDPAKLGLPMAGNASQRAAHAAYRHGRGCPPEIPHVRAARWRGFLRQGTGHRLERAGFNCDWPLPR